MKIVNSNKFTTGIYRSIERVPSAYDLMRLRIEDTLDGESIYVGLNKDEREALIALLSGDDLEVKPKFNRGDIVRFSPEKSKDDLRPGYSAQHDALAVVVSDCGEADGYVEVKWICTRGNSQNDGFYPPECFEVEGKHQLSDLDHRTILNRVLDKSI